MIAYRARGAKTDRLIPARIAIGGYTGTAACTTCPSPCHGRPSDYLDAGMATNGEYLMTRHDVLFIVLGEAPSKGHAIPEAVNPRRRTWTVPAHVTEAFGDYAVSRAAPVAAVALV